MPTTLCYRDHQDNEVGPISIAEERRAYREGRIDDETPIRLDGAEDWSPAGEIAAMLASELAPEPESPLAGRKQAVPLAERQARHQGERRQRERRHQRQRDGRTWQRRQQAAVGKARLGWILPLAGVGVALLTLPLRRSAPEFERVLALATLALWSGGLVFIIFAWVWSVRYEDERIRTAALVSSVLFVIVIGLVTATFLLSPAS